MPVLVWLLAGLAGWWGAADTEPFRNNDETRHVMTGVFVRDALHDLPASAADPKGYAVRYFAQHPALGLLIWPPLFYFVEGAVMAVAGTGHGVARGVVAGYALVGLLYAYALARRGFGRDVAAVAVAALAVSRLPFDFARFVLLEVPTLALVLGSVWHFERHLLAGRRRDALLACLLAAAAALTRFDGVLLLPYFGLRLLGTRNLRVLRRPAVLAGVTLAVGLTLPYYFLTWREYNAGLSGAAVSGTGRGSTGFLHPANFWLYPSYVPFQVGWVATLVAAGGLAVAVRHHRRACGPWVGLLAATYLTFVPLAEPEARHAIYWVPAVCGFAAVAVGWVRSRVGPLAGGAAAVGLIAATGFDAVRYPGGYIHGYAPVARYVADTASGDRPVLFDGTLNGNFVYQLRRADPGRRLWVVRGDKLLYASLSDARTGYTEFAATDAEVLAELHRVDPELIVVESPHLAPEAKLADAPVVPAADRLRRLLAADPGRFRLEGVGGLATNHDHYGRTRLLVYRKLDRNPDAARTVEVPVLGMGGRRLGATR